MKNSLIKGLMVFLTMLGTTLAYSQDVSGTVSDASGPLPGASVLVKGTTKGAQTDAAGKFTIKDAGANAVLTISYIGLKTQEVNVAGRSTVKVTLQDGATELGQVVVIGYGSVKKKDATGAVDQISSKNFDNVAATSPAEILRGKVSGLQVTSSSGEPGAGMSLRVRGSASFRSGSNALIVVDGIPLDGGNISAGGQDTGFGSASAKSPLNFINQNDIESISVLKDASSTAIYGSRGANGVIMITTKKGKTKEPQLTYSASMKFGSYASDFDMLSANQFASFVKPQDDVKGPAAYAAAIAAGLTPAQAAAAEAAVRIDKTGRNYNWKDVLMRNSFSTNHDLSFTKSTENSNTRFSVGASNTEGIVQNTGLDKYSVSFYNSNDFFGGKLKVEGRVAYTTLNDKTTLITNNAGFIGNVIGSSLYWNPTRPVYNSNGDYNVVSDTYLNPQQLLDSYSDRTKTNKLIGSINTTLKLTSHLKYQFLFGVENSNSARKNQLLPTINVQNVTTTVGGVITKGGFAVVQNQDNFNKTFEHTLNYNNSFGDNFDLDVVGGYSYYDYNASGNSVYAKNFSPLQLNLVDNLEGVFSGANVFPSSFRNRTEIQSYFGRANATLYKNLLLTATVRIDGSSKLGANNKYGTFPSFGAAYKLVSEKEGLVNAFKIRTNYGITGNSEFLVNSAIEKIEYVNGAQKFVNNGNPNLKWETSTSYGLGADFELLKNKLTGTVDYFIKDTKDLIYGVPGIATSPSSGYPQYDNFKQGILQTKGLEISLNYKIINTDDLKWDVSANAAFNQSLIKDFPTVFKQSTAELNGPGLTGAFSQQFENGQPIYSYYLQEFLGYDSNGISTYSDVKYVGKQALPKMNLGFNTSVTYKSFDVVASFYGAFGHYIYNNTANALFFKGSALASGKNITADVANSNQGAADTNPGSTKYLEKGDFIRLGNLTLGYTVKADLLEKFKIKAARFYVNGSNLLLFTNYSGFDPEVDINKSIDGVPSTGIDYLSYPKERSYAVGLNLTF
jgi:TonB-dependent starch-binding outer membrane protein SusC